MKDTKELILKTAYDLFLSSNYEAVTINRIIKATGLTKGGIYHYFASKEDIFKAVVDRYMMKNSVELPSENISLKEMIVITIQNIRNQMLRKNDCSNANSEAPLQFISLMVTAMRHYPEYVEIKNTFFTKEINKWKEIIENAIKNNEIRAEIDVEILAMTFLLAGSGIVPNFIFSGSLDYALNMYERQLNETYKLLKN